MKPISEEEVREAIEFVRSKTTSDWPEFEQWANELLDRAHHVGRGNRR